MAIKYRANLNNALWERFYNCKIFCTPCPDKNCSAKFKVAGVNAGFQKCLEKKKVCS